MSFLHRCISNSRKGESVNPPCISRSLNKAMAALAAMCALGVMTAGVPASANPASVRTIGITAQDLPNAIVDYDFTDVENGSTSVNNKARGSTLGEAKIQNIANESTKGTFKNGALQMDGNVYVKLPDDILKNKASVTVSTQVKNDTFNNGGPWTYLWALGSTGQTGTGSWAASTHTSLYTSITSKGNGEGETFFPASENLSFDDFQTLTATVDGTTNLVKLYLNGRQVGQSKATTNPSKFKNQTNDVIGNSRYPGVGDALFHGAIKNFAVYDGALSQEQIAQTLPKDQVSDLLLHQAADIQVPTGACKDFTLPSTTDNASVSWQSSNAAAISLNANQAHVTLPMSDTDVTLTATLSPNAGIPVPETPVTKTFTVRVPKAVSTDTLRKLIADAVKIESPDNIRGNILLPATLSLSQYGVSAKVVWTSSDTKTLKILPLSKGATNYETEVNRPTGKKAQAVELTATVTDDGHSDATVAHDSLVNPVTRVIPSTVQPLSAGNDTTHSRISSHDPSIVKTNGKYYIFGSHRAFARSTDLQHWEYFHNNLTDDYENVLHDIWQSWPKQESNPDVAGNMWAPEVIWNKTMNKWCMYLSINGGGAHQKTLMALLTADDIEGDWTVVGPVIYSGFEPSNVGQTDVPRVLGSNADISRYQSLWNTGINAIDASVKYDEHGDLWMALGSWFGGIWMIKLDPATGLRDYNTTYETTPNVSDAYYGHKLAGGFGNSGEGVALTHAGDYWYMTLSYGGLTQGGGYQMREFRSRNIYGPYTDQNGNSAVYTQHVTSDLAFNRGLRIDSSYVLPGSENAKTAQGGNAFLTDDDGSIYNIYHTRFVKAGGAGVNLEEHQVRVTPMVLSPDGWLVMAPFEKSGSLASQPYTTAQVAGKYSLVVHNPIKFYAGGDENSDGIYHAITVQLNTDGSLGADATGTWTLDGGAQSLTRAASGTAVTLNVTSAAGTSLLHGVYRATLGEQTDESGKPTLFMTGDGGDVFTDDGPDATSHGGSAAFWAVQELENPITPPTPNQDQKPNPNQNQKPNPNPKPNPNQEQTQKLEADKGLSHTGTTVVAVIGVAALLAAFASAMSMAVTKERHSTTQR
ncbi:family 43 glycosylhydrolase [Bifidobacterium bombi]|uniref:Fused endo-1,5-alpha-L-arabinosidase and LamG-containing protein n=1 Tax=Bifidobacterium bombi DSM 19703 TaxID=1341695 RepID=A0A080N367_9BIFI|nr:family 43 glycosylhydrolase [Bifidobacterium bombi]KFF31563.1 fused endo-1,5-alpha-L-arabinosidase and LamG-containing protein [Bifidobacterium bombi DSM 19703]